MGFNLFKATISIDMPGMVKLGDDVPCVVKIAPTDNSRVKKIELTFSCRETAISRGSTDTYYHKNVIEDLRGVSNEIELQPGFELIYNEIFKVPLLAPPSFHGSNHLIRWYLGVRLDVPWWPDTIQERELIVFPAYSQIALPQTEKEEEF